MELLLEIGLTICLSFFFAFLISKFLPMVSDDLHNMAKKKVVDGGVKEKRGFKREMKVYQRTKRERKNLRLDSEERVEVNSEPAEFDHQINSSDLIRQILEIVNEDSEPEEEEALEGVKDAGADKLIEKKHEEELKEGNGNSGVKEVIVFKRNNPRAAPVQLDQIRYDLLREILEEVDEEDVDEGCEPVWFNENNVVVVKKEALEGVKATGDEDKVIEEKLEEEVKEGNGDSGVHELILLNPRVESEGRVEFVRAPLQLDQIQYDLLGEILEEVDEGCEPVWFNESDEIVVKEEALEGVKATGDEDKVIEEKLEEEVKEGNGDSGVNELILLNPRVESEGRVEFVAEPAKFDEIQSDLARENLEQVDEHRETVRFGEGDEIVVKEKALEGVKATGADKVIEEKLEEEVKEGNGDLGVEEKLEEEVKEGNGDLGVEEKLEEEVKECNGDLGVEEKLEEEVKEGNGDLGVEEKLEEEVKEGNGDLGVEEKLEEEVKEGNGDLGVEEKLEEEVKEGNGDLGVDEKLEEEVKEGNGDLGDVEKGFTPNKDEESTEGNLVQGRAETGEGSESNRELTEEVKMSPENEAIGVSEYQSDRETEVEGRLKSEVTDEKGGMSSDEDDWEDIEKSEVANLFATAAAFVGSPENSDCLSKGGSDVKMQLYALHKVATEGPCQESQPMALKVAARAKWNAWQQLGSMNPETAMDQYISLLSASVPGWMGDNSGDGIKSKSVEAKAPDVSTSILHQHILETERPEVHQLSVEKGDAIGDPNSSNTDKL